MEIKINVAKKHLYAITILAALILGGVAVVAFGGSNPAVMGHSALELIVNSSSIVDGSVTSADILDDTITDTDILSGSISGSRIDEGSLDCGDITNNGGGSGLCDGVDNGGISGCSSFSASTTVACSPATLPTRLTGGGCSCPSGSVTTQTFSVGAGNEAGSLTCGCTAGTPTATVFCCT